MLEQRFDVVIAGAGPAGSSAALRFARAGFEVALVDHQRFPRPKPCGEFMSPQCLPILRDLGVEHEILALGARRVDGMLLHAHGRRARGRFVDVGAARAPVQHGSAIRREVLDDALLRAALRAGPVRLFEGARVTGLLRGPRGGVDGITVRGAHGEPLCLRARLTIGADGVRSRVARALGVQRSVPWLDKLAITARYAGVAWGDFAEVHLLDGAYFACTAVDGGHVRVNLVVDRDRHARIAGGAASVLAHWMARAPELAARVSRGALAEPLRGTGRLACRTLEQAFDGAALVGDASGYVDPLTGEGIFFALKGAEMLAEPACAALRAQRVSRASLAAYVRGRRREIAPRAALAALLQRALRHPRVVQRVFALLEARPDVGDVLVSVAGDYVPLRELRRPKLWWDLLQRGRRERAA